MISVIIPTLNAEATLAATLTALVPAAVEGLVREVIVVDGGSTDRTTAIADESGATILTCEGGRGAQLRQGAEVARFPWLLFLHADTELEPGWEREATVFMDKVERGKRPAAAAAFRFVLDDEGFSPRLLERIVVLRCALLRLPYGDQGLLLSRSLYDEVGGFAPLALMEDVALIRRLGRRRVALFRTGAITSAQRYRQGGYLRRTLRNLSCLALYFLGVPPDRIARIYGYQATSRASSGRNVSTRTPS